MTDDDEMEVEVQGESSEPAFDFAGLPVEIQEEILKKLKTAFLQGTCARVCIAWEDLVTDILEQRRLNVNNLIPEFFRQEMAIRLAPEVLNDSIQMLKFYENTRVMKKFNVTAIEINSDVWFSEGGLIYHLWQRRHCDCKDYPECLLRTIHLIPTFNLFVDCCPSNSRISGPRFYHLSKIMSMSAITGFDGRVYACEPKFPTWLEQNQSICNDISVYRDHILFGIAAKTLLLVKICSVDHKKRRVYLERVRIVHLPIWMHSACLFENKLITLYTTGYVGLWDKEKDELFMSTNKCDLSIVNHVFIHRTKMYRIGTLALIKVNTSASSRPQNDSYQWYAVDTNDETLRIHQLNMCQVMDAGLLEGSQRNETQQVFHIDMWYNCLIVFFQVPDSDPQYAHRVERRLAFKLLKRYPTLEDFLDPEKFRSHFICSTIPAEGRNVNRVSRHRTRTRNFLAVPTNFMMSFTSPIIPSYETGGFFDLPAQQPSPVADLIAVQLTPKDLSCDPPRRKLRAFRIRISNRAS